MISDDNKKVLLTLARSAIKTFLETGEQINIDKPEFMGDFFDQVTGVFVTLTKNGQLRGCIGNIIGIKPLKEGIVDNAVSAAFGDPRFEEVTKDELDQIKIEISILSKPIEFKYKDTDELTTYLNENRPGVVLESGFHSATYLPQVWEDVVSVEDFLSSLCTKAGLSEDEWKKGSLKVKTYTVEHFEEERV
jgi:AmmeMemoRadiSam system protein A